jgi:hypothetical protein
MAMDRTGGTGERPDEASEAMGAGLQAAFGDGIVRGTEDADGGYDGRDDDHGGLVGGGPVDAADEAGGSRAGAGEVAADRARAEDAEAAQEETGLASGEVD